MALRVLLVDDSKPFLTAARDLLEREGLTVSGVASTSAEALDQVSVEPFDVVLVDVFLGDESGFALARQLDERVNGTTTTVILISTYSKTDVEDLLEASPAAGFLSKHELSAKAIRHIIDRPRRWAPTDT